MQRLKYSWCTTHVQFARATTLAFLSGVALLVVACGNKAVGATPAGNGSSADAAASRTGDPRVSACKLMPKEEMNALTGASYTTTETNDDGRSSESNCHYFTPSDPAGMSLNIDWVNPADYSNPAEHAALQKGAMGGAKLAGKVTADMPTIPGAETGPVEGIGDEATVNMMMLTARKGDYTITVQIIPTDMMKLMTDTTAAQAFVDKEKVVARKVLAKL